MTIILSDWPDAKPGAPHLDSTRRAHTRCLDALVPYSASKFKKPGVVSTEPVRHGPAAVDNGRMPPPARPRNQRLCKSPLSTSPVWRSQRVRWLQHRPQAGEPHPPRSSPAGVASTAPTWMTSIACWGAEPRSQHVPSRWMTNAMEASSLVTRFPSCLGVARCSIKASSSH